MEIVKLSGDEWRTLVIIPAVISLAVNLLTPLTRRAATALIVKAAGGMRGGLNGLLRIRVRQINDELAELRELRSNNSALLKHYQSTVVYLNFGLLILFLSPIIGIVVQALASNYINHLPEFYAFFARVPGAIFVLVFASLLAAGPFQALIYSSSIKRKLNKLISDPENLFKDMESEKAKIEAILNPSTSDSSHKEE